MIKTYFFIISTYNPKISAIPSNTIPSITNPKLIYCFLVKRSFKNIRSKQIVRIQWNEAIGAVSTGLIGATKMNVIVPNVSALHI